MDMSLLHTDSSRTFLAEELAKRLEANPRYSLRSFAKKLQLSAGELSEVLRGKRQLSLKSALKVSKSLDLNPTETKHLLFLCQIELSKETGDDDLLIQKEQLPQKQLTLDYFNVVSSWTCFAILNLADCHDFQLKPKWIARRLGITAQEAQISLERLVRVGVIHRDSNGVLKIAPDYILSPSEVSSEAVATYHKAILKKAIQAIDLQSSSEREMASVGFAADPKHVPSIKKEINEFLDQLVQKFGQGRKSEVYQCHISLFRLTEGATT